MTVLEAAQPTEDRRMAPLGLATIFLSIFAMSASFSFVFAVLPPIGRDLGLSEIQLSLVVAPAMLIWVLANGVWGSASERLGRKPIILLAITTSAVVSIAFGFIIEFRQIGAISVTLTFLLLAGSRMTLGGLSGGVVPATQAYVADRTSPNRRTGAIAVIGSGFALGMVMGPGIAAVTSGWGATVPFFVVGGASALVALIVLFSLSESAQERLNRPKARGRTGFRQVWPLLAMVLLSFTSYGILLQVTGFRMQDQFGLTGTEAAQRAGTALTAAAIGLVVSQMAIARLGLSIQHGMRAMLLGVLVMLSGLATLALADALAAQLIAMAVFGIGMGMVIPTALGMVTVVAEVAGDQGRVGGWSGAAQGLGMVLGPPAGAFVYRFGLSAPYVVGLGLLLVAAVLAVVVVPVTLRLRPSPVSIR